MKSRIITLLVALLCLPLVGWGQSVWNGTADVSWYNENQMEFTISTAEELAGLAELVNEGNDFKEKTIVLANDIILNENVLNAEKKLNSGSFKEWTPIGNENNSFLGSFDGNNKKIIGCYINNITTTYYHIGLFGKGRNIKNLEVIDSYINVEDLSDLRCIGGIVGYPYNGDIINCSFDGVIQVSVTGNLNSNALSIGGICGIPYTTGDESNIESCYNKSDIQVSLNDINMGMQTIDIAGVGIPNGEIVNSYNSGNIYVKVNSVKTTDQTSGMSPVYVSGIGRASNITSCYNVGNITVSENENANNTALFAIGGVSAYSSYSNTIKYCYNYGEINSTITTTGSSWLLPEAISVGNIVGTGGSYGIATFETNYCLSQTDLEIVGSVANSTTIDNDNLIEKIEGSFESGEIAWNLRDKGGYGQNLDEYGKAIDETPVLLCFAGDEQKVYKLTLESDAITKISGDIYRNAEPAKLLQQEVYDELIADAEEGKDLIWKNTEGEVVAIGNDYTPSTDETLTAEWGDVYTINTVVEPAGAGTILVQAKAQEGDEISFTVTANEGYELASVSAGEVALAGANGSYLFTMPATNVTITATFNKVETEQPGDDDDEDQGDTGIHKPQRPIKYYNIYVDTICPGLNVEVSKDVVQEGHQVSAYLTIQAECDTTGMRFEYKRGLFGYWKDLKELEGVQPGEYIIKNIYTDIYIRALDATLPEEEPTGIEDLEGVKAYAKDGSIYVYTPNREEVTIISMSGAIIKHAEQVGLQSYSINRGIYIVRIGEKVFKLKN